MNTRLYKKLCNEVVIKALPSGGFALYGKEEDGNYTPEETKEGRWITYPTKLRAHQIRRIHYFEPTIIWLKSKWYVKLLRFIYKLAYAFEQSWN